MGIGGIEYFPESDREKAETKIIYSYGDEKGEVQWVKPEFGEIISNLTGIKIKNMGT
jgi:hypothetical protein